MEVVKEDEFIRFCREQLGLETLDIVAGEGNTEFVLRHEGESNYWDEVLSRRVAQNLHPPFEHGEGHVWSAVVPELIERADTSQDFKRSEVQLLEDGNLLPFGHDPQVSIESLGGGRYNYSGEHFYFSTSDNSDPNINGRRYSIYYDS